MLITFELSDEEARELQAAGIDLARRAKEALLADLDQTREKPTERERPNLTGDFWKRLDPETHERFAAAGISEADFEAAAQGIRPLPKSESDRRLAESIRELENTEPNMVLHLADIIFVLCGDEPVPTLRQLVPDELALAHLYKMREGWEREWPNDPQAIRRGMLALNQKKKALFHDLTSQNGGPGGARKGGTGGEGTTSGGAREKPQRA